MNFAAWLETKSRGDSSYPEGGFFVCDMAVTWQIVVR